MMRHLKRCVAGVLVLYVASVISWLGYLAVSSWSEARKASWLGFVHKSLTQADGRSRSYLVFVPHVPPPKGCNGYPVLMFLNGHGDNGNEGLLQIGNNFGRPVWEMQENFPFLVVAPQCEIDGSWVGAPDDSSFAFATLDRVLSDYPCDKDRVYLTGTSSGGAGAFRFLQEQPETFAAAVLVSATQGGGAPESLAKSLATHRIPMWSFFNERDSEHVVKLNRSLRESMFQNGCNYRTTEYDRKGHNAWDYAYRDPAMYRWLLEHSRKTNRNQIAFEPIDYETQNSAEKSDSLRTLWIDTDNPSQLELAMEARINDPIGLRLLFNHGDIGSKIQSIQLRLGRPGDLNCQAIQSSESTELFGLVAIREDRWNHLAIQQNEGRSTVSINGWPVWRSKQLPGTPILKRVGVLLAQEQNATQAIRELRGHGVASASRDDSIVASGDGPDEKLTAKEELQSVVLSLKKRSDAATHKSLFWQSSKPSIDHSLLSITCTPSSEGDCSGTLIGEDGTFLFSRRRDDNPHRMSSSINQSVELTDRQYRPAVLRPVERPGSFSNALASGFTLEQPNDRPWRDFWRSIDQDRSTEILLGDSNYCSKVIQQNSIATEATEWARLTTEIDLAAQLDTLNHVASLLSLGRVEQPPIAVRFKQLEILDAKETIDGHECLVVRERQSESDSSQRLFWIDQKAGGLIRRFCGKVERPDDSKEFPSRRPLPTLFGDVTIHIQYDSASTMPVGWTIANGQASEGPLQSISTSTVASAPANVTNLWKESLRSSEWTSRPHSLVKDQINGVYYLRNLAGKKRIITSEEYHLSPTFDELAASATGKVEEVLNQANRQVVVRFCIAVIGLALLLVSVFLRRHKFSVASQGQPS
jgi:pimeloyl-ACP methyl ester carboxylesterase